MSEWVVWEMWLNTTRGEEGELVRIRGSVTGYWRSSEMSRLIVRDGILIAAGWLQAIDEHGEGVICVVREPIHFAHSFPRFVNSATAHVRDLAVRNEYGQLTALWLPDNKTCGGVGNVADSREGEVVSWVHHWGSVDHIGDEEARQQIDADGSCCQLKRRRVRKA